MEELSCRYIERKNLDVFASWPGEHGFYTVERGPRKGGTSFWDRVTQIGFELCAVAAAHLFRVHTGIVDAYKHANEDIHRVYGAGREVNVS